jgi:DNA-directed RNA polymerase specialized sigma subunit
MAEDDISDELTISRNGRQLGNGIIDTKKLIKMKFKQGKTNSEIATYFAVSRSAVGQMLARVNNEAIGRLYTRSETLLDEQVDIQMLITGLMADAAEVLRDIQRAVKADDNVDEWDKMSIEKRKLMLATMSEIRAQIGMYQQVADKLYSIEAHSQFQKVVVDVINEEAPEVAEKIRQRLARAQPLREFIGGSRRAS